MIEQISQISGVGVLRDAVPEGGVTLSEAVAVYADNGCGKSTLACLLRSLRDNDCDEVLARRTLGEEAEPHAEVLAGGRTHTLSGGAWDAVHAGLRVFDDEFVEMNVSLGRLIAVMHLEELLAHVLGRGKDGPDEVVADTLEEYRDAVNARLRRFGAGFELARLERVDGAERRRLHYALRVTGREVPLAAAEPTSPSFPTTLSSGDRRALALALFLAGLDAEPDLAGATLVFDEPAAGLDGRRTARLIDALSEFIGRGVQVIVLSHDAAFLRTLRDRGFEQVLQLARAGLYCAVEPCDIDAVCALDYEEDEPQAEPF